MIILSKLLLALSAARGVVSIALLDTAIGVAVGIANKSISLVFDSSNGIVNKIPIATQKKRSNHNKITLLARSSSINSTENIISKALACVGTSHEEFVLINGEARKYCRMKGSITSIEVQRSDIERDKMIGDGKKIGIDEMIK